MPDLIDDLFAYNDWANQRVLALCDGLTDKQLDTSREMGFGTLRATLFHVLTAEVVWLERWERKPWRSFPTDPEGISLSEIRDGLQQVARVREGLVQQHRVDHWSQRIQYKDSGKTPYDHVLFDLLVHVVCHGVHHRAQALNYLKAFDRTVVAGIDYIFYRLAEHAVKQTSEAVESMTDYGLSVGPSSDGANDWDPSVATRLFQYHDWAIGRVLEFAADLPSEALDQNFQTGPGSIRSTLLHLFDAETWWLNNWTMGPNPFPDSPTDTTVARLVTSWTDLAQKRNEFVSRVDQLESQRVVEILAGGPPSRFRVGESVIHVGIHGVHHRAQLINMLRHVQAPWENIDLLYAIDMLG